jgi:hypothetical protein
VVSLEERRCRVVRPYVIREGDYLLKVVYENGFDADVVWGHARNAGLRTRKGPNILAPGDTLFISDAPDGPDYGTVQTGSTNSFVSRAPPTRVTVKFELGIPSGAYVDAHGHAKKKSYLEVDAQDIGHSGAECDQETDEILWWLGVDITKLRRQELDSSGSSLD